jgi:hypothetical protein
MRPFNELRLHQELICKSSPHPVEMSGFQHLLARPCVALSSCQAPSLSGSRDDRVQLVLSVDNMNTKVSGRKSVNAAAEP